MVVSGDAGPRGEVRAFSDRWTLNRAGIVNVYQYENETLHFGGGRLLLRGVNGSGKSTAMNMLLPFLITASLRRIDAAGEQTGVLKSWMLSDRDDPQPLGYLWIELSRGGGGDDGNQPVTLTCGCGVKANRSTDSIRTWWFITDRRPGIDLSLVEGGVPLSDDALRAGIGSDAVFPHDRRGDYRTEIRRRLFGGADLEQHLQLLNAVRNPRVGDRIDLELPTHLTDALPALSDRAIAEAARPLDDLDEHRRNVATLTQTNEALVGLATVYHDYLRQYFTTRVETGRQHLDTVDQLERDSAGHRRDHQLAEADKTRLEGEIADLGAEDQRLTAEIAALKDSPAYREGAKLVDLEVRVTTARENRERVDRLRTTNRERLTTAADDLGSGQAATDGAVERLTVDLDSLGRLRSTTNVAAAAPSPPAVPRSPIGDDQALPGEPGDRIGGDRAAPTGPFDAAPLITALDGLAAGATIRRREIDDVVVLIDEVATAASELRLAEERRTERTRKVEGDEAEMVATRDRFDRAIAQWDDDIEAWRSGTQSLASDVRAGGVPVGETGPEPGRGDDDDRDLDPPWADLAGERPAFADHGDRAVWRRLLDRAAGALTTATQRAVAQATSAQEVAAAAVADARAEVERLDALEEPEPPSLPWQRRRGPCLADLVDFAADLDHDARAGLEAALEASGLLMATVGSTGMILEDGDLVILADGPAPSPLSDLLTVTVPDGLSDDRADDRADDRVGGPTRAEITETVAQALASISTTTSAGGPAAVDTDGRFRLGPAHGRHTKSRAEYIGATARRETLARARTEARAALAEAEADLSRRAATTAWWAERRQRSELAARDLPPLTEVDQAHHRAAQAEQQLIESRKRLVEANDEVATAEADHLACLDRAERTARSLQLPSDRDGLSAVQRDLNELVAIGPTCAVRADNVQSQHRQWEKAADRWRELDAERVQLAAEHRQAEVDHDELATKLATLQDSIGLSYREVVDTIAVSERDLRSVRAQIPGRTTERESALRASVAAAEKMHSAEERAEAAEAESRQALDLLDRALALPGVVHGLTGEPEADMIHPADPADPADPIHPADPADPVRSGADAIDPVGVVEASSAGLRRRVTDLADRLARSTGSGVDARAGRGEGTSADGLRLSLRQRRDGLGSGWDAEARQPDDRLPIVVEVEGPIGQMPLPAARAAAANQLDRLSALLTAKQDDALRGLLQGLVANEVAEKMDTASRLVGDMNRHLRKVRTAHGLGVELRWRRRGELVDIDPRMIDLLAKLPDLRTADETTELRGLVSAQLSEARALEPEASYRELIASSLDYRRWHEMTVLTRWRDDPPKKLGRNHRFSEGEKKLVTYLPFLAAVAVSCDALAENDPAAPRFVLLDDAMAKVSEDNHADLLGLLVDLDLDFIATSERLWGTHATVPDLMITEVVRDAQLGAILLDHFHWDGTTLTNRSEGGTG